MNISIKLSVCKDIYIYLFQDYLSLLFIHLLPDLLVSAVFRVDRIFRVLADRLEIIY